MDVNRVAFFHGMESKPVSEKNRVLESGFSFVYAPPMNYRDPSLFTEVLNQVKESNIELLIGSSMGGWFAYCISTLTGIPTLLFNPALHSRQFDPQIELGEVKSHHTVILGRHDRIIDPVTSLQWLAENKVNSSSWYVEMEHRIPIEVFEKWVGAMKLT